MKVEIQNNNCNYTNSNNYSADMIIETADKKFVSTSEKNIWSDKYTKNEVDNKFSAFETNVDWKESIDTFSDITTTYPNAQDGWTVNVKDTDYTYRYNGSEWVVISANAIPKVTQEVDGLLTKEDYTKIIDSDNQKHTHTNKNIVDSITQQQLENWDSVTNKVDKVTGKSLISDAEISKISKINVDANNNITNNSGTATKLETARKINGVDFDGTADISIAGNNFVSWVYPNKTNTWCRIFKLFDSNFYIGNNFIFTLKAHYSATVINYSIYVTVGAFKLDVLILPSVLYDEKRVEPLIRILSERNRISYIEVKTPFPEQWTIETSLLMISSLKKTSIEACLEYVTDEIPEGFMSKEINCKNGGFDKQLQSNDVGQGSSLIGISDTANNFTSTNVEGALLELINNSVPIIPLNKSTFVGNTDWNTAPKGVYTINNMTGANAPNPNGYAYGILRNTIIPTGENLSLLQEYEPFPSPAYPNPVTYKRVCFDSQWSDWNTYPSSTNPMIDPKSIYEEIHYNTFATNNFTDLEYNCCKIIIPYAEKKYSAPNCETQIYVEGCIIEPENKLYTVECNKYECKIFFSDFPINMGDLIEIVLKVSCDF